MRVFLYACAKRGVKPRKLFSSRFNVRIPPALQPVIATAAAAAGKSINQGLVEALEREVWA